MKRLAQAVAALSIFGFTIGLAGCSDPWVGSGVVIDKEFVPELDYWTSGGYAFDSTGKYIYVGPQYVHEDEQFILVIREGNGNIRTVHVNSGAYYTCDQGATFNTETGCF